jgi:hypothetical protein
MCESLFRKKENIAGCIFQGAITQEVQHIGATVTAEYSSAWAPRVLRNVLEKRRVVERAFSLHIRIGGQHCGRVLIVLTEKALAILRNALQKYLCRLSKFLS